MLDRQRFSPWSDIRPLIESGGQVISVQTIRDSDATHGRLIDSELLVRLPDGMEVKFRPSEFAAAKAFSLIA